MPSRHEELREAIQRTSEATRRHGEVDVAKIAAQSVSDFWNARQVVWNFRDALMKTAHSDVGWMNCWKLRKEALADEESYNEHLANCEKCRDLLASALAQIAAPVPTRRD